MKGSSEDSDESISKLFSSWEDDLGPMVISDSDLSNIPLKTLIVANLFSYS